MLFARSATLAAVLAIPLCAFGADAATITDHIAVTLDPDAFTTSFGPVLTTPVKLAFDLTFDPNATVTSPTNAGIANFTYNYALDSSPQYVITDPSTPGLPDALILGGAESGVGVVTFGTNDFYLHVTHVGTTPIFQQFGLTTTTGYYYTPTNDSVTSLPDGITFTSQAPGVSPVPLPASLPMFGAAVLGLGGYRAFRRKLAMIG